jgi:hypothetical protein
MQRGFPYRFRKSSGSLAMFAAIRRASWREIKLFVCVALSRLRRRGWSGAAAYWCFRGRGANQLAADGTAAAVAARGGDRHRDPKTVVLDLDVSLLAFVSSKRGARRD